MKPDLWEFSCFEEKVNELHLNEDLKLLLKLLKLRKSEEFVRTEANQDERAGWGRGDPQPGGAPLRAFSQHPAPALGLRSPGRGVRMVPAAPTRSLAILEMAAE